VGRCNTLSASGSTLDGILDPSSRGASLRARCLSDIIDSPERAPVSPERLLRTLRTVVHTGRHTYVHTRYGREAYTPRVAGSIYQGGTPTNGDREAYTGIYTLRASDIQA